MVFHLDTSAAVDLMREAGRGDLGPAHRCVAAIPSEALIRISAFALAELWAGVFLARRAQAEEARLRQLLELADAWHPDEHFPRQVGALLVDVRRRGRTMSSFDLLVAAAATADGATLITRDVGDFSVVQPLRLLSYSYP